MRFGNPTVLEGSVRDIPLVIAKSVDQLVEEKEELEAYHLIVSVVFKGHLLGALHSRSESVDVKTLREMVALDPDGFSLMVW